MKSLELQPSKENLLRTFEQNAIERNIDIFRFVSLLNVIEDNCSIALDGAWGSGKTFFVKQTKMVLDAYNKFIGSYDTSESNTVRKHVEDMQTGMRREPIDVQPEVSVYYDAWSNDNDIDPMLSLVYEILQTVNTDYSFKKGADCLKIAAAIADFFTGKKVTTLVEAFTQTDRLAALKEQKSIHTVISEFLESLLAEQGNRLVIFVDELDRCKPSYAVQLLERIKHYFSNERVTFVFSINTNELQHTVERYYGDNFDSCKYLDRFFDLKLSLPPINLDKYFNFIGFNDSHYTYDVVSGLVIKHFHFEMREIAKYVRLTRIAGYSVSRDSSRRFSFSDGKGLQFCLLCLVPIMIGLKISDTTRFSSFINGKDSSPIIEILGNGDNAKSMCHQLLGNNESYTEDKTDKPMKMVKLEDKLNEVYNALFINKYAGSDYEKYIGDVSFDKSSRAFLLRIVGLLSDFTDYQA